MADPTSQTSIRRHNHAHDPENIENGDTDSSTHHNPEDEHDSSSYNSEDDAPPYDSDQDYEYEYYPATDDPVSHLVVLDMTSRVRRNERRYPPPPSPPPPSRKRRTNRQRQGLDPIDDDDDDDANEPADPDEDGDEGFEDDGSDDDDGDEEADEDDDDLVENDEDDDSDEAVGNDKGDLNLPRIDFGALISADGSQEGSMSPPFNIHDPDLEEEMQRRRDTLQLLDLGSAQPLISDGRRIYALTWSRAVGTDLVFSVPNTAEGETYRPQFLGSTRARLIAQPLRARPRAPSPPKPRPLSIWARARAELAATGDPLFNDADLDVDTTTDEDDDDDEFSDEEDDSIPDYFDSGEESESSTEDSLPGTFSAPGGPRPIAPADIAFGRVYSEPELEPAGLTQPTQAAAPDESIQRKRPHPDADLTPHSAKQPRLNPEASASPIASAAYFDSVPLLSLPQEAEPGTPGAHDGRGGQLAAQRRDTLFGEFANADAPDRPHGVPRRLLVVDDEEDTFAGREESPDLVTAIEEGAGFAEPDSGNEAVMSGGRGE